MSTSNHNCAVATENLSLNLFSEAGEIKILKNINLKINQGESIGFVGPSGAGKTTMMMIIAGLEKATAGRILVKNNDITNLGEDDLAVFRRKNIGIVFQDFHLIPTMKAIENVAIPLELAKDKDAFLKAEAALKEVGLKNRILHYPSQLSGGEQQRVALARAIINNPSIILADEPTGNLDGENGEKIINLLFELQQKNQTTLFLITHDMNIANRCSRIIKIEDGIIKD